MKEHELRVELERRHLTLADVAMACERDKPETVAARWVVPVQYVEAWLDLARREGIDG